MSSERMEEITRRTQTVARDLELSPDQQDALEAAVRRYESSITTIDVLISLAEEMYRQNRLVLQAYLEYIVREGRDRRQLISPF